MKKRRVDGQRNQRDDRSRNHRRQRIPRGIKGPRINRLCRPQKQRNRKHREVGRRLRRVHRLVRTAAQHQVNQRRSHRNHPRGSQQAKRSHARNRVGDFDGKIVALALRPEPGEKRHRRRPGSLRKHGHGSSKELFGIGHHRYAATVFRCEVGDDPVIRRHQRYTHHQRNRKPHPLAKPFILPIENRPVARSNAPSPSDIDDEWPRDSSSDSADGQ